MTSKTIRDPLKDHLLTPQNSAFIIIDYQPIQVSSIRSMDQKELVFNIVHTAKAAVNYRLPIVHSTVMSRPAKTSHRFNRSRTCSVPIRPTTAPRSIAGKIPALDALKERYEVYAVADAVGGTSVAAHEAALRRIEQAGGKLISKTQLYCELQRDWNRTETVPGFMDVFQNWDGTNPERDSKAA